MIGIILGCIGFVATIGFGIYSIVVNKKINKRGSLGLKQKACYSLF
jgi:hypothetical protein